MTNFDMVLPSLLALCTPFWVSACASQLEHPPLPAQWDSSAALRLSQASSPAQPSHTEWVILQTPHGPFRLLCSTEEKIHESRFRSTSIFTLWNHIENILLGERSQSMPLWIWTVSTADLNRTKLSKCSDGEHYCKNEMAVGEVVSSQDFSL